METNERFIGLIGLGYWGRNILRNLYDLGALRSACDTNPETISERRGKFPGLKYTASYGEMLSDREIKAIAIATPAVTHYELVKLALNAGKDVFVEKPLALTIKEGKDLVEIAEKEGRILMVGHILQYHPAVLKLKDLISSGELGKVQYIYSNRLNIGKLRTEENILWSFAPHDISVILMLIGEEPVRVEAFGGYYLNRGIYDTTLTTLDFKNGVKGHIFVSWLHPYKEQKLIIVGSKAMAVFDDVSEEKLSIYPHRIEWMDGKMPVTRKADSQVVPVERKEPLGEELKHFIECVQKRNQPRTDGREGLKVLNILTLAEEHLLVEDRTPARDEKADPYFVHESSYIDGDVEIGQGTKIWHYCHVSKGSSIGKNCVIGQNVMIGDDVKIGDRCKIQNNVSVFKGVVLEDEVFCGPSCVFTNVYNPRAFVERKHEFRKTLVKKGATIGANATIVCGATVGKYAMIGSGAVIKADVLDYAVVAGVPAHQIGWACKCGTTLKFNDNHAVCGYCGNEYSLEDDQFAIIKENHERSLP
jgi:UDP-2-acetamido-3-amino-2,3-dideoxy-glucuronate N-acetyltransferase